MTLKREKVKITGIELSKLLPHSDWEDGMTCLIPQFISERFAVYNFADAKAYDEVFNFPNSIPE